MHFELHSSELTSLFLSSNSSASCFLSFSSSTLICEERLIFRNYWTDISHVYPGFDRKITFLSLLAASLLQYLLASLMPSSARCSWLVTWSLVRANSNWAFWHSARSWLVFFNLNSQMTASTLGLFTSCSVFALNSCLPSFFPFLWQKKKCDWS